MQESAECVMFAVLARSNRMPPDCVVCGRLDRDHELPGVRLLTTDDVRNEQVYHSAERP